MYIIDKCMLLVNASYWQMYFIDKCILLKMYFIDKCILLINVQIN